MDRFAPLIDSPYRETPASTVCMSGRFANSFDPVYDMPMAAKVVARALESLDLTFGYEDCSTLTSLGHSFFHGTYDFSFADLQRHPECAAYDHFAKHHQRKCTVRLRVIGCSSIDSIYSHTPSGLQVSSSSTQRIWNKPTLSYGY